MSYIVPREKPKCYNCQFRTLDYCGLLIEHDCVTVNVNEMTVSKYCPLVEIPTPHGRLIDADKFEFEMNDKLLVALTEKYGEEEAKGGLHFSFRDCISNIKYQPTVIEAEGSET